MTTKHETKITGTQVSRRGLVTLAVCLLVFVMQSLTLEFKRGERIDQFGREQVAAPDVQGGPGVWEHRFIGLCSSAPGTFPRQGFVFKGCKPGTSKVYLDNLRLRHADGRTTPIRTNGKDTRFRKIADSELFTHISMRAVPAVAVGK